MIQKAFSTAPAEDLTQICFNHKFQKEYINNKGGRKKTHCWLKILSDFSNFWPAAVFVKLEINFCIKKKKKHGTQTVWDGGIKKGN